MRLLCACHAATRCADYGVVSGYNDDFPQRGTTEQGVWGEEQVLLAQGLPPRGWAHKGGMEGGAAPMRAHVVRDFNRNMFQC